MRKLSMLILAILLAALIFRTFSKEDESITDQASQKVDEITTEAADTAVRKVRTPLNKARGTKDLGQERTDAIDKAMQGQ